MKIEIEAAEIVEIDGIVGLGLDCRLEVGNCLGPLPELDTDDSHDVVEVVPPGMDIEQRKTHLFGLGPFALFDERADLPDLDGDRVERGSGTCERFHGCLLTWLLRYGI